MNNYVLSCLVMGITATLLMTSFLWTITYLKLCNVDMVKAIGSWFTRKEKNALLPGLIAHFSAGVVFCFLYVFVFSVLPNAQRDTSIFAVLGAGMGIVHGIVVALCLVILVAEHHPLPKFRKAGFSVAIYHVLAHVLYGLTIGSLYILFLAKA